jgi:hypothetical protein
VRRRCARFREAQRRGLAEDRGDGFGRVGSDDVGMGNGVAHAIVQAVVFEARDAPLELDQFVEAVDDRRQG